MKTTQVLSLVITFLWVSCSKEEIPKEVLIQYELSDDVSPVKVSLRVEGDFHWAEWQFDRMHPYFPNGKENGVSEYVFEDPGVGIVEFSGSYKNDEKCFGRLAVEIPGVATKVEFTALSASRLAEYFPDLNGEYKVEFSLHDPYPSVFKSIVLNLKDIKGEKVQFNQPVQFHIPRFYDNTDHFIHLAISKVSEPDAIIRKNIFLKQTYLNDRLLFGKTQIGYGESGIFLETDWKP